MGYGLPAAIAAKVADPARTVVVQRQKPAHDAVAAQGFRTLVAVDGPADGAVVILPRARAEARASVAAAAAALPPGAPLWIDGQKTDGVDAAATLPWDARARATSASCWPAAEPAGPAIGRGAQTSPLRMA